VRNEDERAKFNLGRQGETNIVSDAGLYSLIMTSRKPAAKRFKRWVTHEVLPAIKDGSLRGEAGLMPGWTSRKVIPLHKHGLSAEKTREILKLWRENSKRFPEKSAAYLTKLTAGQARVGFVDVVWVIIEDSRR